MQFISIIYQRLPLIAAHALLPLFSLSRNPLFWYFFFVFLLCGFRIGIVCHLLVLILLLLLFLRSLIKFTVCLDRLDQISVSDQFGSGSSGSSINTHIYYPVPVAMKSLCAPYKEELAERKKRR